MMAQPSELTRYNPCADLGKTQLLSDLSELYRKQTTLISKFPSCCFCLFPSQYAGNTGYRMQVLGQIRPKEHEKRPAWSSRWCFCPAVVTECAGSVSTCSHDFNLILDESIPDWLGSLHLQHRLTDCGSPDVYWGLWFWSWCEVNLTKLKKCAQQINVSENGRINRLFTYYIR